MIEEVRARAARESEDGDGPPGGAEISEFPRPVE